MLAVAALLLYGGYVPSLIAQNHPQAQAPGSLSPERPGFASALAVWKQSAMTASASRSLYLRRAAADLTAAGNPRYAAAVQELMNLASIPETGLTSAQMAKAHADIRALDSFFGTPGLALSSQLPGPAASPGCPSSAALLAGWNAAPASAFKSQGIAPGLPVSGFSNITCSQGWVLAYPITKANGYALFSEQGGLHMLSTAEMRQFHSTVCSSPSTPSAWKNPAQGPCG
jgi:hypothetical protein